MERTFLLKKIENISNIRILNEDINTLKENIIEKENKEFDYSENESDIREIKDKVMFLEKRLYQIIAGELSTKKVVKKDKKNSGQIMLFGEELLSVNDFAKVKENYNFEELEKTKEEKVKEIKQCGYYPYIIKDLGKFNKNKVVKYLHI